MNTYPKIFIKILFAGIAAILFIGTSFLKGEADENPLSVKISRPGEGETLYSGPDSLQFNAAINGWVTNKGSGQLEDIDVILEVIKDGAVTDRITTNPTETGFFEFLINVNPGYSSEQFPPGLSGCGTACHFPVEFSFPTGQLTIRVNAYDKDGNSATCERRIIVDLSRYVYIPVKVKLTNQGLHPLENIPISASSWLYIWRTRYSLAITDQEGYARLKVEALSEATTNYVIKVEPSIVGGVLYESVEPVEFTLHPGTNEIPEIVLIVKSTAGQIKGKIGGEFLTDIEGVKIWAGRIPDWTYSYVWVDSKGGFSFDELPIGEYMLFTDNSTLYDRGFSVESTFVDLSDNPHADVFLSTEVADRNTIHGVVMNEDGEPLPFAWVEVHRSRQSTQVNPENGSFILVGDFHDNPTLIVSAPGYYSQAYQTGFSSDQDSIWAEFKLAPTDNMQRIIWGDGFIHLPPESNFKIEADDLELYQGWVWGRGGTDSKPITIGTAYGEVSIQGGRFAVADLPDKPIWLYVFEGEATAGKSQSSDDKVTVREGQMAVLERSVEVRPLEFEAAVVTMTKATGEPPFHHLWQPTLDAQIRDRFAMAGIGSAQFITSITYMTLLTAFVIFPFSTLYWLIRRRSKSKNKIIPQIGENNDT